MKNHVERVQMCGKKRSSLIVNVRWFILLHKTKLQLMSKADPWF